MLGCAGFQQHPLASLTPGVSPCPFTDTLHISGQEILRVAGWNGTVSGAITAQILGQAIAGWSLVAHVMDWDRASVWVIVPLIAAIAVPFRHDDSLRDRATGNFSAAIMIAGLLMWEVALGGLTSGGPGFGIVATLMLVATVLFCIAGAFFWILREGAPR